MPLKKYGLLVARAIERRREGGTDSPHHQIRLADGVGATYRAAVNVLSQESPSELLYFVDDDLEHPITGTLAGLQPGWHALGPRGGLDFIRGNLLERSQMRALPPDVSGPDNDLADMLDHYVQRAIDEPGALVYAFGEPWGPESARDKVFGFRPGNGVHDIHMNQGNSARFRGDDGVWQDGGLIVAAGGGWTAILLRFQSQSWTTDDRTGHARRP
ncbi:MAG TPA: YukJ family protein [Solirubrobacteraceae bacterium]|nr:YukJ family protein [Solirubrobacteraceae bacterium]